MLERDFSVETVLDMLPLRSVVTEEDDDPDKLHVSEEERVAEGDTEADSDDVISLLTDPNDNVSDLLSLAEPLIDREISEVSERVLEPELEGSIEVVGEADTLPETDVEPVTLPLIETLRD